MTRDEAVRRINELQQFVPGPCPGCGAVTLDEAATRCQPVQSQSGEWGCPCSESPDEDGLIYVVNPQWAELEGYLWHWHAFDEGYTRTEPTWERP